MGNNYKFISLFSGAMGLDLGLEQAGWEGVLALDNDKMACETVRANIQSLSNPEIKIVEDDIRNYTAQNLVRLSGTQKKDIFAIVGGPPCQAFSSAGKRLGLSDERGNVFITFLEIIDDIKPPFVVIENVRGML